LLHKTRANSTLQLSHGPAIASNAKNLLALCGKMSTIFLSMGNIPFFDFWAFGGSAAQLDKLLLLESFFLTIAAEEKAMMGRVRKLEALRTAARRRAGRLIPGSPEP